MPEEQKRASSFGDWLRRQRKARDWTQAELAQRVGCAVDTIKKIETALSRPSKHLATRIATVLGIPPGEQEAMVRAARDTLAVDRLSPSPQPVSRELPDVATLLPQLHQLRTPLPDFVGQHSAIATLLISLRQATHDGSVAAISGVRGMGGIGKTELALLVANRLTAAFPDAQIMLNLRGASATPLLPEQALHQVIHAFSPNLKPPDELEAAQRHYHSLLHGKRVLIVADDARDTAQVRPLLPPKGCALLITSRLRFSLPGMTSIDLEVLAEAEAVRLLYSLCTRLNEADARTLSHACGYLPLALRISGSLLHNDPALSVVTYLQQLADERQRLHHLRDPNDPEVDVETTLKLSYARLEPEMQEVFRQLGVLVADFTSELAQAVVQIPAQIELEATLHKLLRYNLVIYDTVRQHWRLHDLLRDVARLQLEVTGEAEATHWRYTRAAVQIAQVLSQQYLTSNTSALSTLAQFDAERPHIDVSHRWLTSHAGTPEGDRLLLDAALATISLETLRYDTQRERIPLWEHALAAAQRLGNRHAQGQILNRMGIATMELGAARRAITYYEQAIAIARDLEDQHLEAISLGHLGIAHVDLGNARPAIAYLEQTVTIYHALGNRRLEGIAMHNLGYAYAMLGEFRRAITYYEHYLTIARTFGDRRREGTALHSLGEVYADLGEQQRASELCENAIAIFQMLGDQRREGVTLNTLAYVCVDLGDTRRAITCGEHSRTIMLAIGDRRQEAYALNALAYALAQQGDITNATNIFAQTMLLFQEVGDRWGAAKGQWRLGLALAHQRDWDQALPLLRVAVAYEQEIGHAKAEEHAALLARLEAGEALPPELRIPTAQRAIGDTSDEPTDDNVRP